MNKEPWIGNHLNNNVKVLILGESHYDEESNYGDKVTFPTSGVIEYYFIKRERWASFFDKIAASFGYEQGNAKNFYEQVYFGNYVDVVCGIQDTNCASYYIGLNRQKYNNDLFEFINQNGVNIVICFSKKVYDNLPKLGSKQEVCSSESIGQIGKRNNILNYCLYYHDIEHPYCDVKLKNDLKVFGIRHPSAKCGYKPEQVYMFMKKQEDVKHICFQIKTEQK